MIGLQPFVGKAFEGFGLTVALENLWKWNNSREEERFEYARKTILPHELSHMVSISLLIRIKL